MKKIILAVLVCSLFSCELSENKKSLNKKVAIYDNNFERKLIELKYDDIIDGYVSKDGIKYCRFLDLSALGLFDLKGIEAFDSLRKLNVSNNQLTSIDLSKNTELVEINIGYNQLTSIDLSKNTGLVEINIENNQLTNMDLSKNTKLVNLNFSDNQLTIIDLSKNTKLVGFFANPQKVDFDSTRLNIDGCDSLKYFDLPEKLPESVENDLKNKGFNRSKKYKSSWSKN